MRDAVATATALAKDLSEYMTEASANRGVVNIALSGGSTPQILFRIMAEEFGSKTDWRRIHFFWVDERCVATSDSESNYGNAYDLFFSKIDIPAGNIHHIHGDDDPHKEAHRYAREIEACVPSENFFPRFDVILLGMGDDGHTASIFPGQGALLCSTEICGVSFHPVTLQRRITLTGSVINNAREIIFLVTGSNKSEPLRLIHEGSAMAEPLPARHINPVDGNLWWYIDEAAAAGLR